MTPDPTIITSHIRDNQWTAHRSCSGQGATEAEAVADLLRIEHRGRTAAAQAEAAETVSQNQE